MTKDLQEYGPDEKRPKHSNRRKMIQLIVFGALLALSLVWLPYFYFGVEPSNTRTLLLALFAANGVAAMVNLYRTFRPHKS